MFVVDVRVKTIYCSLVPSLPTTVFHQSPQNEHQCASDAPKTMHLSKTEKALGILILNLKKSLSFRSKA